MMLCKKYREDFLLNLTLFPENPTNSNNFIILAGNIDMSCIKLNVNWVVNLVEPSFVFIVGNN